MSSNTYKLQKEYKLTVTASPNGTASVVDISSGAPGTITFVAASASTVFGPYLTDKEFTVSSDLGGETSVIEFDGIGEDTGGTADDTTYDNATSGLTADNVQDAIDEVVADAFSGDYDDLTNKPLATNVVHATAISEEDLEEKINAVIDALIAAGLMEAAP